MTRPRDPLDAARDHLARAAEAEHPGWRITHGLYGWTAVRDRDGATRSSDSLPGLDALITITSP